MAVVKVTKGGRSLKKAIDYIAKKAEIVSGINCSDDRCEALEQMKITKEIYGKTDGRQYKSYVLSFPPKEVSPQKAHEIGREWAERNFPGHEVYVGTHTDKQHIHTHVIVNSVNFENGKKIHLSKNDLEKFKDVNDEICSREGLSVPERGKPIEGQVRTYNMAKHQLLQRVNNGEDVKSYVLDTAIAVNNSLEQSSSEQEFIQSMNEQGYKVNWQPQRKHITIVHPEGYKVRMSNLEKTFNDSKFTKEGMALEFQRFKEQNFGKEGQSFRYDTTRERSNEEQSGNIGVGEIMSRTIAPSGNSLTDKSIGDIQRKLCDIERRTGQSVTGNIPSTSSDKSRTISKDTVAKRRERDFSR